MTATEPQGFLKDDANIERLCGLAGVSRAGSYRRRGPSPPSREQTDLRDLIQRIALMDRHYGYRRIAVELRRQGLIVNAKRVLRLMRVDNLSALPGRAPTRPGPFVGWLEIMRTPAAPPLACSPGFRHGRFPPSLGLSRRNPACAASR
jgi:transposase InsO family protein